MNRSFLYIITLLFFVTACFESNPKIKIITEFGEVIVELNKEKAPLTVENFLKYVDGGYYKNTSFYRSVNINNQPDDSIKINVLQGGIWEDKQLFNPIEHETTEKTGIKHKKGTISMARLAPGTAMDDFFICIDDQPELDFGGKRNKDGQGFAAFGKIISGMDIIIKIHQMSAEGQFLNPKIKIKDIQRIE